MTTRSRKAAKAYSRSPDGKLQFDPAPDRIWQLRDGLPRHPRRDGTLPRVEGRSPGGHDGAGEERRDGGGQSAVAAGAPKHCRIHRVFPSSTNRVCLCERARRSTTTLCNNPFELHELASAARQPGNGITQLRTSLFEPQLAGFSAETRVAEAFLFLFRLTTVEHSVFLVDIDAENMLLFQDILHRYGVLRRR